MKKKLYSATSTASSSRVSIGDTSSQLHVATISCRAFIGVLLILSNPDRSHSYLQQLESGIKPSKKKFYSKYGRKARQHYAQSLLELGFLPIWRRADCGSQSMIKLQLDLVGVLSKQYGLLLVASSRRW